MKNIIRFLNNNRERFITAKNQVLLEEYKARWNEINLSLDAAYSTSNITLVGVGAVLSISNYLYESEFCGIFAIFSILFFAITWTQLRFIRQVFNLSNYINNVIAPQIRKNLKEKVGDENELLLSWETEGRKVTHSAKIWLFPIEAARYGIPLFAAVISFFAFFFNQDKSGFLSWVNHSLIYFNAFLFLYSSFAIINTRSLLKNESSELESNFVHNAHL